jgi:GNAT superfamily N-acetyltransferase
VEPERFSRFEQGKEVSPIVSHESSSRSPFAEVHARGLQVVLGWRAARYYPWMERRLAEGFPALLGRVRRKHMLRYTLLFVRHRQYVAVATTSEGVPALMALALPVAVDLPPQASTDWLLERAAHRDRPNALVAYAAVVDPAFRGRGLSEVAVRLLKALARNGGLPRLLAPLRPASKAAHPEMSMTDWLGIRRPDGSSPDPWLRVHERLGGVVVHPCVDTYSGTLADLDACYPDHDFGAGGSHTLPDLLAAVSVDLATKTFTYREPNVWLEHAIPTEVVPR